jgi:ketosteroid isomerase-like protein
LAFDNNAHVFSQLTHPEIEWMPFEENHTLFHGLDGAMRIRNGWFDAWDEHRLEIDEAFDGGVDDVVATVHLIGRGRGSGAEVDVHVYGQFKVRDGKVVYLYEQVNRAEALKAAGLAE